MFTEMVCIDFDTIKQKKNVTRYAELWKMSVTAKKS